MRLRHILSIGAFALCCVGCGSTVSGGGSQTSPANYKTEKEDPPTGETSLPAVDGVALLDSRRWRCEFSQQLLLDGCRFEFPEWKMTVSANVLLSRTWRGWASADGDGALSSMAWEKENVPQRCRITLLEVERVALKHELVRNLFATSNPMVETPLSLLPNPKRLWGALGAWREELLVDKDRPRRVTEFLPYDEVDSSDKVGIRLITPLSSRVSADMKRSRRVAMVPVDDGLGGAVPQIVLGGAGMNAEPSVAGVRVFVGNKAADFEFNYYIDPEGTKFVCDPYGGFVRSAEGSFFVENPGFGGLLRVNGNGVTGKITSAKIKIGCRLNPETKGLAWPVEDRTVGLCAENDTWWLYRFRSKKKGDCLILTCRDSRFPVAVLEASPEKTDDGCKWADENVPFEIFYVSQEKQYRVHYRDNPCLNIEMDGIAPLE